MSHFFKRIHRADRVLSTLGWFQIFVMFVAVCSAPWDHSALEWAANPWAKVMRYAAGLAIYAWTLALFVQHIPNQQKVLGFVRWGIFGCLTVEILAMAVQAVRGLPSHYNVSGTDNALLFATIGLAMFLNSMLAFVVLFLYLWEDVDLPRAYLMGIRLGFVMFAIGSLEGMIMIINQAHTFGAPDGGPGIPLLEWSTKAGDLRVAHLAGVFGIQALPLAGWAVHRLMKDRMAVAQVALVTAVAGLWVFMFVRLFSQAVAGRPLFGA